MSSFAVGVGDFAAGDGTREMFYDASMGYLFLTPKKTPLQEFTESVWSDQA